MCATSSEPGRGAVAGRPARGAARAAAGLLAWLQALLLAALVATLLAATAPARAASYVFPTSMPAGCSGSNGSYSCSSSALQYGDTATISGTKPATITFSGDTNLNGARINQGGAASDLTLVVNGVLTPGYQAVLNASVVASAVTDSNGGVSIGGTLRATRGAIALGYQSSVTGAITAEAGSVTLADQVTASGSITASGDVTTGFRSSVAGAITAGGTVTIGQEATVSGAVANSADGMNISVGYAATVSGAILSAQGSVTLAQNARAQSCVQVQKSGRSVTLGTGTTTSAVCCGSAGSCSNSCVANNSGAAMPGLCSAPAPAVLARYGFEETAYNGTAGELKDSAGHASGPFNGKAEGSPLPSPASAGPARSGSVGTCGYATLPGSAASGGRFTISGLPVSTTNGAKTTVAFWMYWTGTTAVLPVGWNVYNLYIDATYFGFNTGNGDVYAMSSSGLANGWHHVVAVFNNGSVTGSKLYLNGTQRSLTQYGSAPNASYTVVGSTLYVGGIGAVSGNRMVGRVDELRVFQGEVSSAQVGLLYNETRNCTATQIARYDMEETAYTGAAGEWKDTAGFSGGPFNGKAQGSPLPTLSSTSPAVSGSPGSCSAATLAGPAAGGGSLVASGLPLSTEAGAFTTVAFWMYWNGVEGGGVLGFHAYTLWFFNGSFGFNSANADIHGIASTGLSGGWHHVVAVFQNGNVSGSRLYIDGVLQTLTQRLGTANNAGARVSSTLTLGGWSTDSDYRFQGRVDQLRVYNGPASDAQVATLYAETPSTCASALHHLAIEHASGSGLTCTPSTVTVRACQDAACSTPHTAGVTGTLTATGGSVQWPGGASFSIASGSSTTTVRLQATTTTATVLGTTGLSPSAANTTSCNFGSPSCTFTAADSGLLFDVPHHVAETAQTVSISAVKKADNSLACTPAFASVTRSIAFSCSYGNPNSGTLPVRVGTGTPVALNAAGNAGAACDGSSKSLSLAFDANGTTSTTVLYADAGQVTLNASYTGGAGTGDTGLVMSGSDSFIAAPDHFTISGVTPGPIRAGSTFSATVTARNALGNTTPNHGRETSAQRAYIGWVMRQPYGAGASPGSFSGTSARSFTNGAVTVSDLAWTEVGRGDLVVRGSDSAGYFGSGLHVFGSSSVNGARTCAAENGNCVLPGGTTATVYYGAPGGWTAKGAQTGTVACTNGNFGDPISGTVKRCYYAATAASNGSVGDFIPHRFTVTASHACGAFSYAGQPIATTVTAQNTAGNTTLNFSGSVTPSHAQAVTLADANGLGLGTLSGNAIAASAFNAGAASAAPSYAFTSKATAPQSLVLRATNGATGTALVSSQGYAEPTLPLRSGRLRLANAFGKSTAALQLAATTEYWSGSAWLLNSADSCTSLAGASVALSNPRGPTGAASTATSSAGALAISSGSGSITLAAPSPAGSSLSLDVAVNLGSTATDQSCQASHPATTGAGKPWLRAQNGSCAATADRDPAARASFGIFAPETRKAVHVRDLF